MRQALRQNRAGSQTATSRSVPAPYGGWDTSSPLMGMPKQNAVILDNMIPRGGYVELRRGFNEQCTGTADPVETLIAYRGDPAGDKIFAAAGAHLYDVSSRGALPAASYSSAASARWSHTNFANDAGAFAILANGAQAPVKYDGSAFAALTITGSSGSITLAPADLINVMSHKKRLWFIEKETLRVWFLDVNAIQGAAGLLDLGPVFDKGGYLVAQGTWSLDGGAGMDDVAVFITNQGQVAIYQGLDPTDAAEWSLVGVFSLPKPISERCVVDMGMDLGILTEAGVLSLTSALRTTIDKQPSLSLSRNISPTVADAAAAYKSNFGWGMELYSGRGGVLIVNVPTAELSTAEQWVMNTETRAWCRFTGIPAFCWGQANGDDLLRHDGRRLPLGRQGASDNSEPVVADVLPAFRTSATGVVTRSSPWCGRCCGPRRSCGRPSRWSPTTTEATVPTAVQTVVTPGDISADDSNLIRNDWTGAAGDGYVASPRMRISLTGADDVDRVAVTSDHADLLLVGPGGSDHILTRPNLPLDVTVECVGFDLMFQPGGVNLLFGHDADVAHWVAASASRTCTAASRFEPGQALGPSRPSGCSMRRAHGRWRGLPQLRPVRDPSRSAAPPTTPAG
jgi:hypothetical protein